jgi:hypothetical protein
MYGRNNWEIAVADLGTGSGGNAAALIFLTEVKAGADFRLPLRSLDRHQGDKPEAG